MGKVGFRLESLGEGVSSASMHSAFMFMRSVCRDLGLQDLRFRFCVHMCTGSKLEWFFIFI